MVLKNLIIPKFNNLILTLPNPNNEMLKEIDKELYYFLWGGKVHKIKKNIVIQDYRLGGLKMIDLSDFTLALKSSWIRRLLTLKSKWLNLLEAQMKI